MSSIELLPEEVLLDIFGNLDVKDLGCCAQTCKKFHKVSLDETLWQKLNLDEKEVPSQFLEQAISRGLTFLSFRCAKVTGNLFWPSKENSVKYLNVSGSNSWGYKVHEEDLMDLVSCSNSLEKLSLSYLPLRNPVIIEAIVQNGKNLNVLDLFDCKPTSQTVEKIVDNCVQLKEVNFTYTHLSKEAIDYICDHLTPNIMKLSLSHLNVTDENVKTLVQRCDKLTELDLQNTCITGQAVTYIIENLSQTLTRILLPDQIDISIVLQLGSMPKLKYLWYYGPPSLDDPDLIDEIEHDRLKRELSHLSIDGYSKPIATPHTGNPNEFWEIKCKQTNQFPRNSDFVKHVEETDKWMDGMSEFDFNDDEHLQNWYQEYVQGL